MPKRRTGIYILVFIIVIAIGIGLFNGTLQPRSSQVEQRQAFGLYPIVIAIVLIPVFIAFLSNSSPEQPVHGVIRACREYEYNKKFEAIRPYLSKKFLRSPKVLLLVQWHPVKPKSIQVEITEKRNNMLVRVILKNNEYYVFTVLRRENYIDPVGTTDWVIDDIQGPGF